MRTVLFGLALCVTCLAEPTPDVEVVVPPSAAHPQDWPHPQIRENPNPDYRGKPATFKSGRSGTLAVATVGVGKYFPGLSRAPGCVGFDKVPVDSLYVSYVDLTVTVGPSRSRCRERSSCPLPRSPYFGAGNTGQLPS